MVRIPLAVSVMVLLGVVGCGADGPAPEHFDGPNAFQSAVGCRMAPTDDLPEFGGEASFNCGFDDDARYPAATGVWFANHDDLVAWERAGTALSGQDWPRLVGDRWAVDGADVADLRELQERIGGSIHR